VRRHGLDGRIDLLVRACLRDATLDHQLEGSLAAWLLAIAKDGGATSDVRRAVLAAASRPIRRRHDAGQIASILGSLALDGDRGAASALLRMIEAQPPGDRIAAYAMWALGEDGWRRVLRSYGRRWNVAEPVLRTGWIVHFARSEVGPRRMLAVLREMAAGGRLPRALVEYVEEESLRDSRTAPADDRPAPTLDRLERLVTSRARGTSSFALNKWGREASAPDRAEAWRRLLAETDPRRIRRRLQIWSWRRAPAVHPRLLALLEHEDRRVRLTATRVLGGVRDPRVRAAALRMLRADAVRALDGDVLDLLELNARDEDAPLIDAALPRRASRRVGHNWVSGVGHIVEPLRRADGRPGVGKSRPSSVWTPLLVRALEISPCRMCREFVLHRLVVHGDATESMLREALFDANSDTREVAREALRKLSSARARGGSRGRPSGASAGP
jgi:hypothetical protein